MLDLDKDSVLSSELTSGEVRPEPHCMEMTLLTARKELTAWTGVKETPNSSFILPSMQHQAHNQHSLCAMSTIFYILWS